MKKRRRRRRRYALSGLKWHKSDLTWRCVTVNANANANAHRSVSLIWSPFLSLLPAGSLSKGKALSALCFKKRDEIEFYRGTRRYGSTTIETPKNS